MTTAISVSSETQAAWYQVEVTVGCCGYYEVKDKYAYLPDGETCPAEKPCSAHIVGLIEQYAGIIKFLGVCGCMGIVIMMLPVAVLLDLVPGIKPAPKGKHVYMCCPCHTRNFHMVCVEHMSAVCISELEENKTEMGKV